jgi:ubiquinone/menaquinone biosynthesis C-methylase UbiE
MKKGQVSNILRKYRLIYLTDWVRYYIQRFNNRKINRDFRQTNPSVILPDDYLIYESFQLNYKKYYTESIETAQWIVNLINKHIELKDRKILDWGCGPGRVIRHLPSVIGNGCSYYGTDYNAKSIDWCSKNIPDIHFNTNTLEAKLPYEDNFFDIIYGISIFTHLSEQMHQEWYNELYRILKPGGLMLFTTHGDLFRTKLTDNEIVNYNKGKLIVRGKVKEGHRTYSAFQPTEFMENLFRNARILEHMIPIQEKGRVIPQDIWIIQK